jgi:chromosome segregation ATPase
VSSVSTERELTGDHAAAVADATRAMRGRLDALLASAEAATRSWSELGARCADLEREGAELRETAQGLRRERDEAVEALGELRVAYEALLGQYETGQRAVDQLAAERDALRGELAQAAEQLDRLIRTLRG